MARRAGERMDFEQLIPVMRLLALQAGDKIMQVYNGPDFEVRSKSDASPVTEADEAADAIISAGLRAAFPDVVLITEEQADSHALTASTFLIVDPLDGTKEFVARNGDFAVNIALIHFGKPILGIICVPVLDIIYWAVKDGGSYKIENGVQEKIMCNTFNINDLGLRVPVSRSSLNEATKQYISRYNEPDRKSVV